MNRQIIFKNIENNANEKLLNFSLFKLFIYFLTVN